MSESKSMYEVVYNWQKKWQLLLIQIIFFFTAVQMQLHVWGMLTFIDYKIDKIPASLQRWLIRSVFGLSYEPLNVRCVLSWHCYASAQMWSTKTLKLIQFWKCRNVSIFKLHHCLPSSFTTTNTMPYIKQCRCHSHLLMS